MTVAAVVFDLDGVVRRFDPAHVAGIEERYGLPPGALHATAFDENVLVPVTTGRITDDAWRDSVAARLTDEWGVDGAGVVAEWSSSCGAVDHDVLAIVRAVRLSVTTALLTNATSRLPRDLAALALADEFDHVFNSSELGWAKPAPEVFTAVLDRLGVRPRQCVFVDDSEGHVAGAAAVGIRAHVFESARRLRDVLAAEGVPWPGS